MGEDPYPFITFEADLSLIFLPSVEGEALLKSPITPVKVGTFGSGLLVK